MNKFLIIQGRLKELIANEENFEFGEFIMNLRKSFGLARRHIEHDLGISGQHLSSWELNLKQKLPDEKTLVVLSDYYACPSEIVIKKARKRYPNMK
jgi:transcriptional regulator with XRE-family HTH domain